jgi:hypothetical protein
MSGAFVFAVNNHYHLSGNGASPMKRLPRLLFTLYMVAMPLYAQKEPQITGTVVLADGTPVEGADVATIQDCGSVGDSYETRKVVSDVSGRFSLPAFDPQCRRYQISASKQDDYWLPTGDFPFRAFGKDYPVQRVVVQFSARRPPEPVRIVLNQRGGKVAIQVREVSSRRFIWADLAFECDPPQKGTCQAAMPTGLEGSGTNQLFSPGNYSVQVASVMCGDKIFSVTDQPKMRMTLTPGGDFKKVIEVDIRAIKVVEGFGRGQRVVAAPPICK